MKYPDFSPEFREEMALCVPNCIERGEVSYKADYVLEVRLKDHEGLSSMWISNSREGTHSWCAEIRCPHTHRDRTTPDMLKSKKKRIQADATLLLGTSPRRNSSSRNLLAGFHAAAFDEHRFCQRLSIHMTNAPMMGIEEKLSK